MIQRRLLYDDGRGVGEPLNETVPIRSRILWIPSTINGSIVKQRNNSLIINNPPVLAFGAPSSDFSWSSAYNWTFSPLNSALPDNVNLITLRIMNDSLVLLRLSHIYAVDEDPVMSQPASVNLNALLAYYAIASIVETQLTGVTALSEVTRYQWQTTDHQNSEFKYQPITDNIVILEPLQIRTFLLRLVPL